MLEVFLSDEYDKHRARGVGLEYRLRHSMCHYNTSDEVLRFLGEFEDFIASNKRAGAKRD